MNTSPYVSFVTWGRNDGYTPDYLRRVDRATNCLAAQLDRAGIDSEIIVVEWNPAPRGQLQLDVLKLPKALSHVTIRGFIVGPQYHHHHEGSQGRGIQVGEAANAGYWHLLRGHPRDDTVLSLDIDSLLMHAAAAYGVKECRWPAACKVFKPIHGRLNNSRIVPVWASWQRRLDRFLANKVSPETA